MLTRRLIPTTVLAALALSIVPSAAGAAVQAADDIADAPALASTGNYLKYDTDGATTESGEPTHVSGTGRSVWFRWTALKTANMKIMGCGSKPVGTHFRVYRQKDAGVESVKNLEAPGVVTSSCNGTSQIIAAQANETYYVVIVRETQFFAPDPGGFLYLSQATPPAITFPGAPKVTGKAATIPFAIAPAPKSYSCKLNGADATCGGDEVSFLFSKSGTHELTVTGTDDHLNERSATWKFTVDADPPQTFIDSAPPTSGAPAALKFHASADAGVTFKCQYDGIVKSPCPSGWMTPSAKPGPHEIRVTATDKFGNVDPTPAVQSFTVPAPAAPAAPQQPAEPQEPAQPQAPAQPAGAPLQPAGEPQPPAAEPQPQQPAQPQVLAQPACRVTFTHGRVTRRGVTVRVKGDPRRACTVSLALVKGKRVVARSKKLVAAGGRRKLVVRPRVALRSTRGVKLVKAAA